MAERKLTLIICLIGGKFLIKSEKQIEGKGYNEVTRYSASSWPTSLDEFADIFQQFRTFAKKQLGINEDILIRIKDLEQLLRIT